MTIRLYNFFQIISPRKIFHSFLFKWKSIIVEIKQRQKCRRYFPKNEMIKKHEDLSVLAMNSRNK